MRWYPRGNLSRRTSSSWGEIACPHSPSQRTSTRAGVGSPSGVEALTVRAAARSTVTSTESSPGSTGSSRAPTRPSPRASNVYSPSGSAIAKAPSASLNAWLNPRPRSSTATTRTPSAGSPAESRTTPDSVSVSTPRMSQAGSTTSDRAGPPGIIQWERYSDSPGSRSTIPWVRGRLLNGARTAPNRLSLPSRVTIVPATPK